MSVKLMTTEQIHTNLATIHNMWPGGIPTEQTDQVNALRSELKRRGVEGRAMAPHLPQQAQVAEGMTLEQLQKELGTLSEAISKSPNDDSLQERFANVRFELRQRSKGASLPLTQTADSHPPAAVVDHSSNGETFQSQLANGNGNPFQNGAVSRHTTEMPARSPIDLVAQAAAQAQRMHDMEQLVRKHNLAKVAADCASSILVKYADPNGDDIDNACTIGLAVATKIYEKVGL